MVLGKGDYKYEHVADWPKIPAFFEFDGPEKAGGVVDAACDSQDRVYVLSRGNHPVMVFEPDGSFVGSWGEGHFRWAHGIFIDSDDNVWIIDSQTHTVEKFTPEGKMLVRLGIRDWATPLLRRGPFNMPTGLATGPDGSLFISDGYANYLVHKFTSEGELLKTWGGPGTGPSEFALPHNIGVDRHGMVYVCDRENRRVQIFDSEGEYVTEWSGLNNPADISMDWNHDVAYVAELGGPYQPKVSIRDLQGKEISSWEGRESEGKGMLEVAHGIGVDSKGNIYECEIGTTPRIQKFARVT
jgi:DNA-binding beta-propeller fold protein YncE